MNGLPPREQQPAFRWPYQGMYSPDRKFLISYVFAHEGTFMFGNIINDGVPSYEKLDELIRERKHPAGSYIMILGMTEVGENAVPEDYLFPLRYPKQEEVATSGEKI